MHGMPGFMLPPLLGALGHISHSREGDKKITAGHSKQGCAPFLFLATKDNHATISRPAQVDTHK